MEIREYRYTFLKFVKDWMLVFAMIAGASAYLIYHAIPSIHSAGPVLEVIAKKVQPLLLFCMLFLCFCKIEPRQMRPRRWQLWLLLVQGGFFAVLAFILYLFPDISIRWGLESFMLCMICPTATACAVVTGKLGGNMADVMTYTVLINLLVAVAVPLVVPLLYPGELSFWTASLKIMGKVFPLLIMPCLAAWFVRYIMPRFHAWLMRFPDLAFYLWTVSLTLAMLMSTRAIVLNEDSAPALLQIGTASLLACAFQFWAGKAIGSRYGSRITAGQALGQKNTVFSIWMGYTFLNPIVSVAGGFYTIWHNVFNSWQLYRKRISGFQQRGVD